MARYADTAGLRQRLRAPNAWRYRDYVIRSFNQDKPYDRFVSEQIAGDEIDPDDPEMLVATGFLRMGPWEQTGMSVAKVTRQRFLDDITDTVGQVFLAHPLQCARCHDHKFDPIPTRDYYSIQAVFATTQFAERAAPFLDAENTTGFDAERAVPRRTDRRVRGGSWSRSAEGGGRRESLVCRAGPALRPRNAKLKQGIPEDQIAPPTSA